MALDGKVDTVFIEQGLVVFVAKVPIRAGKWNAFPEGVKLIKPAGRNGVNIYGYSGDFYDGQNKQAVPNGERVVGGNSKYWVRPEGAEEFRFPEYRKHGDHVEYGGIEYKIKKEDKVAGTE